MSSAQSRSARLCIAAVVIIILLFGSYYTLIAWHTDISFDGAVFLQPIVSLERFGTLTHTYDRESPAEFRFPLTNLAQGMLSQFILNWPVVHFFGITHFNLQISNLLFLVLTGLMICLLILRLTQSWPLALTGLILFFTIPQLEVYALQGFGEVAGAFYMLLAAYVLYLALSKPRYYYWLGLAAFLAFHTKNYLILIFPLLLAILAYLALRQRSVRSRDILRFSAAFLLPFVALPLYFLLKHGWEALIEEIHDFWILFASTQWGEQLGAARRGWHLFYEAISVLSQNHGGWIYAYVPLLLGYTFAVLLLVSQSSHSQTGAASRTGRLKGWIGRLPVFDHRQVVILFLFGISFFYVAYWFHFSTWSIWYRRLFPFVVVNIPFLLIVSHEFWRRNSKHPAWRRTALAGGLVIVALLGTAYTRHFPLGFRLPSEPDRLLTERQEASEVIRHLPSDQRVFGIGWWQAPKHALFTGKLFLDLTTKGQEYQEGYLILDHEAMGIDPDGVRRVMGMYNTSLVWENGTNKLYRWSRAIVNSGETCHSLELWEIGPREAYTDGRRFYPQPGDTFAMWARTRNATPTTVLVWEDVILTSSSQADGEQVTAIVPRHLFARPGRYSVSLYDLEAKRRSIALPIEIKE
jgi:hypothetical protein